MKIKKIISIILLVIILVAIIILMFRTNNRIEYTNKEKMTVVVTTFSSYDFVRQIAGDNVNLIFLLGPRS